MAPYNDEDVPERERPDSKFTTYTHLSRSAMDNHCLGAEHSG